MAVGDLEEVKDETAVAPVPIAGPSSASVVVVCNIVFPLCKIESSNTTLQKVDPSQALIQAVVNRSQLSAARAPRAEAAVEHTALAEA